MKISQEKYKLCLTVLYGRFVVMTYKDIFDFVGKPYNNMVFYVQKKKKKIIVCYVYLYFSPNIIYLFFIFL